jgi:hypothetical protein
MPSENNKAPPGEDSPGGAFATRPARPGMSLAVLSFIASHVMCWSKGPAGMFRSNLRDHHAGSIDK